MAEVVLFHHVQGLTDGVRAFADELRAGGHTVHTPDLFEGELPVSRRRRHRLHARASATRSTQRADQAVADLPAGLVYAGLLLGRLHGAAARPDPGRRPRARCSTSRASRSPASGPSGRGPTACRCRSTAWTRTRSSRSEGDIDAARELVETVGPELAELFVYSGDRHLFTDSSLPSYDADATALVVQRSLELLSRVS